MRWKYEIRQRPKLGDVRERTSFLWFPKWTEGECRWLETATYYEMYCENPLDGCGWYITHWVIK